MPVRTQRSQMLSSYWTLLMEKGFPANTAADMFDAYVKDIDRMFGTGDTRTLFRGAGTAKPKRKLSAWNKFVKANSKKKIYQFANGKLKLKKMGIAFRKTRAGKKSRK